jgi:hypothetical protein
VPNPKSQIILDLGSIYTTPIPTLLTIPKPISKKLKYASLKKKKKGNVNNIPKTRKIPSSPLILLTISKPVSIMKPKSKFRSISKEKTEREC